MIQDTLIDILSKALASAAPDLGLDPANLPTPEVSKPRVKDHGDWSTNLALVVAPRVGRSPRSVAETIAGRIERGSRIAAVDVAGPGFINLSLGRGWLHEALREILREGEGYGRAPRTGMRVQVEFVSANPTGPLHVGTARNAALGDAVANLLEASGWVVEREYYFNDAGRQLELFGASVEARYLQRVGLPAEIPEGGYRGAHVAALAEALTAEAGDSLVQLPLEQRRARILAESVRLSMDGIRATLERFGVRFDTWASERELNETGAVAAAVDRLRQAGFVYEADGATFFRATEFGDEKDRVLIRSNGEPTYFAADCAYVLNKARRGFDRLIYVWGADHHGTVKRLEGAAQALGVTTWMEVLLYQLVTLHRGGEPVRMSRRAGDYVTLDELIDEVGRDAARYTLLARSADSPIDFDIEVVTRQTLDNPVYYVQYAHARVASLLRVSAEQGVDLRPWSETNLDLLAEEPALDLMRLLSEFPETVAVASSTLGPHRITKYAERVAAAFHHFYAECRIITEDVELTQARLWLARGTQVVIAAALGLIGVAAPESMERIDGERG